MVMRCLVFKQSLPILFMFDFRIYEFIVIIHNFEKNSKLCLYKFVNDKFYELLKR